MDRNKTQYKGLFWTDGKCKINPDTTERIWVGRFKGREVTLGRETSDGMDLEDALAKLIGFRKGTELTITEQKKKDEDEAAVKAKESLEGCWKVYETGSDEDGNARIEKPIYKSEVTNINKHLLPHIGHIKPGDLTEDDIKMLKSKIKKTLSPSTQKKVLQLLKRIAKANKITLPDFKLPKVHKKIKPSITDEQVNKYLTILKDDQKSPEAAKMLLVIYWTGARQSEIRRLRWKDVDLANNWLHFVGTKSDKNYKVDLVDEIRHIFADKMKGKIKPHGAKLVFPGKDGNVRLSISKQAARFKKLAELPDDFAPCHGWRSKFITDLVDCPDVNPFDIQKAVGHSNISTTMGYVMEREAALRNTSKALRRTRNQGTQEKQSNG